MPAAPQESSMLSYHLAQMSGNSNCYRHEGITWCGVLLVLHAECDCMMQHKSIGWELTKTMHNLVELSKLQFQPPFLLLLNLDNVEQSGVPLVRYYS